MFDVGSLYDRFRQLTDKRKARGLCPLTSFSSMAGIAAGRSSEWCKNWVKDWVSGCPKNRKVLFQNHWLQLQDFSPTLSADAYRPIKINDRIWWAFSKVMPMDCLQHQRVRIVAAYADELKLSKTPTFYATNRKDWEAKRILMTYLDRWPTETFNEDATGRSRWAVRGWFESTGQRCRAAVDELLGHLVCWIAGQIGQGSSPTAVLQMLLAQA